MRFRVTLNHNNFTTGEVFYTIPITQELKKAEKIIINLCKKNLTETYKTNTLEEQKVIEDCLNHEIEKMCSTETAYYFLIVKEITELSQEEGYPIMLLGNLSGSIISYLLGITKYDPFSAGVEHYFPEFIWGTDTNITIPNFTIGIAPKIRSLIDTRLDSQYGFVACNDEIFKQITLVNIEPCEVLGVLAKTTGKEPVISDLNNAIYNHVVTDIVDKYIEEDYVKFLLYEEIKQITNWDFNSVLRLLAYISGEFTQRKSISNLNNQNFFVSREEFFRALTYHNVPKDIALNIVKQGVWSSGAKREKYIDILDKYNVPEYIKNYFSGVKHLWVSSDCVGRLLHNCYITWYQDEFPEEYEKRHETENK